MAPVLIGEFYLGSRPAISFEVYPPRDAAAREQLGRVLPRLAELEPDFFTVTYGAFGSERNQTHETVRLARELTGRPVACHLTCLGLPVAEIDALVERLDAEGVHNLIALRGDLPREFDPAAPPAGELRYANELVAHLRRLERERGLGPFGIAVGGYPEKHLEAPSFEVDLANLSRKVQAGADVILTQLFYDNADYFRFVAAARAAGITVPIVPGLMPITSARQIRVITERCGARLPEALGRRLDAAGDDPARVQEIGIEHCLAQAAELLEAGAPGLHFYVMNRAAHMERIMRALAVRG